MLPIDLTGKRAFVAGVADDRGYGWAIARALAGAGASVCVGTWPPALRIFTKSLERGKLDRTLPPEVERSTSRRSIPSTRSSTFRGTFPEEVRQDKRYRELTGYTIQEVSDAVRSDFGESCLDVLVHSLANGPEVRSALIDTTRAGYLAAVSASAYSLVSMIQRFGPLMRQGAAAVSLSYLASERVIPGIRGRNELG